MPQESEKQTGLVPQSGRGRLMNRDYVAADPIANAARIALTARQAAEIVEELRQLCTNPAAEARQLDAAAERLREAGYRQELAQVLGEVLSVPTVHPHAGALWIRRVVGSRNWDRRYPEGLDALCRRGEVGRRALLEFLEAAGAKRKSRLVRRALRRHGKWLRTHPLGWRVTAEALANARCYRKLVRWMSHGDKQDLELPLLYCLALGLRGAGREKKSHAIVKLALAKTGAEQQFPILKLWGAMEEALARNTHEATALFKGINQGGWDDDGLCLYYLTRGVIRVQQAEPSLRKDSFASAYDRIQERFRKIPVYRRARLLRRQYRRCLWRMASDARQWPRGLAAVWQSAESWFLVPPLLLVPGLQLFLPLYLFRLCLSRNGRKSS